MAWFKKAGVSNGPVTTFSAGNHIEGYQESIDRRKQEEEEARRQREAAIELARQQREQAQRESEARMAKAGNDRTTAIKQPGLIKQGNSLLINPYAQGNTAATGADIDYSKINEKAKTDKAYKGLNGTEIGKRIMGNGITQEESLAHAADVMKPYQNNEKAMKALDRYVTLDNERTRGMFGRFESGMSYSGQFDKLANEFIEETGVSMDEFRKIAASYSQLKNASDRKQQQEEYAKMSNTERVAKSIVKAPTNILGSYQAFLGNLQDTVDPELGRDYNSEFYRLANENTDIRKAQNDAIEKIENPVLKTVAHFGYNAAVMGAESATAALTGEAGLASFFASGYNQGLQDAENRGLTPEQAQAYALSMGGFEYFTERIPWEGLRNIYAGNAVGKDAVKGSIMPYIKALFKQVGEEAGEEVINGVGETLADAVIAADKSNLNLNIQRYMQEDGLTESEATRKAIWDVVKDTADAAITAALSAGVSAGPALTGQAYSVAKSGRNIAATENNTGTFTRNENSPNYIPTTRESYLANEDYVKAQDTRQSILNASEKAAKGQKISGKEARALYESLSDTYGNLEQAERVRAQKVFEEARAKAEDKAIEEIKQAKTASEVETIKESFVNSERVNEAVEEKKSQMLDQGKATEEDFNQAITPSKAQKMGYEGKEIAADELENLPKRVNEAYELGYSQKANEITKNATKLDVIQIQEKEGGKVEKIKSVSKDSNGVLQFETTSGKKINAAEAIYSDRGKYYFEGKNGILSLDEPALVQLAIDAASTKRGVQVGSLTSALKDMYTLGETGLDFDAAINKLDYSVKTIGKDILKSAFDEGAKLATATSRATNAAVGDGLIREATEGLEEAYKAQFVKTTNEGVVFDENALNAYENDVTDAEKKFLELLSKKIKVNIAFTYNNSTKDRGQYRPDEGKIYLNLAMNKDFFETALHEGVGEFLAASNEKAYNQIVDSVLNAYASTNASQLAKNIRAYQKAYSEDKYGDTARGASRELFNDALGEIFSTEENIKKMFDWMVENEGAEKAEQVKKTLLDYVRDIITIIKQLKATGKLTKFESQRLTLTEKQATDFADQILEAMDDAIANRDAGVVQQGESADRKSIDTRKNLISDEIDYIEKEIRKKKGNYFKTSDGNIGVRNNRSLYIVSKADDLDYDFILERAYDIDIDEGNPTQTAVIMKGIEEYEQDPIPVRLTSEQVVSGILILRRADLHPGDSVRMYGFQNGGRATELKLGKSGQILRNDYTSSRVTKNRRTGFDSITRYDSKPGEGTKLADTVRHSFAGISSATADRTAMNKAMDLKDEGMDDLSILASTGWFLGMDNKWKYEIPDNDLEIFKEGNREYVESNPDFARYQELLNKIIFTDSNYTQEEYDELQQLDEKISDDEYYKTKQVGKLPDFIKHDELFKAYPWLENTDVYFIPLPADTRGAAQTKDNTILLNEKFQKEVSWNKDVLKSTIMHEIQHLIQEQEGFASGASPEWWAAIKDERIQDDQQTIEGVRKHLDKYVEKARKEGKPASTNEFVEQSVNKIADKSLDYTIEDHWKAVADWKAHSTIYHYENMINKLERHIDRLLSDSDAKLYLNTAGEIEARDTANRLQYTKEDRLKNYPEQRQQEVVYPTGTVSDRRFSIKVDSEGRSLSKEQQEYFKDTKVLDQDGNLKVVYHGTMANFTIFDLSQARDTEDIEAFFFSGDYEESNGYGNVGEYYLNITNPADYNTAYDIFFKYKGKEHAGRLTREELQSLGYDGVIAVDEDSPEYTEYLVFNSNQIKRVDNKKPTTNPDVRKSVNVDNQGRELSEGQQAYYKDDAAVFFEDGKLKNYYHGSRYAGFTKFNLNMMDDKRSIFLTDNKGVANTYSGNEELFEPDKEWSYEQLDAAVSYMTGGDWEVEQDGNNIVITEYEIDGTSKKKFESILDAQTYFIDNYMNKIDLRSDESAAIYNVYVKASNPLVIDAEGAEWNEIAPKDFWHHYVDLNITRDGNTYQWEGANSKGIYNHGTYNSKEEFEKNFGKLLRDVPPEGLYYGDLYMDENRNEIPSNTRAMAQYAKEHGYDSLVINNVYDTGDFGTGEQKYTPSQVVVVFNPNQVKSVHNQNPSETSDDIRKSIRVDWDEHTTYKLPDRTYEDDIFFLGTDEEIEAAEKQEVTAKAYIANIIHSKNFAGLMFRDSIGMDRLLTRSTRPQWDWQLSESRDGKPVGHENYKEVNDDVTSYDTWPDKTMAALYNEIINELPKTDAVIRVIREGVAEDARQSKVVFGEESPYSDALNQAKVIEDVLTTINNQLRGQTVSMPFLNKTVDSIIRKYKADISAEDLTMELAQFIGYMTKAEAVDYNQMMNYLLNVGDEVIKSSKLKDPEEERIYSELKKELSSHKINLTDQEKKELISRYGGSWNTVFGKLNSIGIKLNNAGSYMDGSTYSEIADKFLEIAGVGLDAEVTAVDQIATIIDAMESLAPTAYKWDGATDFDKAMDVAVTIIDSYYSMAASIKEANMAKGTEKGQKAIERAVKTETAKLRAKNEEYKAKLNEEFAQLVENRKKVVEEQQEFYKRQAEIERQFKGEKREFYRKKSMTDKEIEKTARLQAQMQYQGLKDTEAKRKHKDNIVRTCMRLINWMNKPTDTRHVPSFLQPALTEMIKSINFMPASMRKGEDGTITAIKWQESMRKLQQVIKSINAADVESISDADRVQLALVMDVEDITAKMEQLLNKYGGTADISRMKAADLKTLSDIMSTISKGISQMNENFMNRRYKHVGELAEASISEMQELKPITDTTTVFKDKAADFLNLDMLEPISFFKELGDASASVMQEFFDGEKTGIEIIREAEDFFDDLAKELNVSKAELRAWSNDSKSYNIDGGVITLSSADIMSLYCSYKREMLDQEERPFEATHHIAAGGIKGFKNTYKKGKGIKKYVVNRNARALHANQGTILELINSLDVKQQAYADRVVDYMSTTLAAHGNETSNKMNGYSKYLGKYYFPLKTENNAIATTESNSQTGLAGMLALVHQSFTHSQLDKADNALVVMNFFDVVTEHITGMANYCAYSMPLSDALRWFNYASTERNNTENENEYLRDTVSIKGSMDRVKGKNARTYFENFLRAVNLDPARTGGSAIVQNLARVLTGLGRAKAVALNGSVWVQQPTAITRAADVIEDKYLAQGWAKMSANPKAATEYAQKESYLCYWKNKGFSDYRVTVGMKEIITGYETKLQELQEFAGAPAGLLDDTTWAAMYFAAEYKIKETTDLQKGTEEFHAAVEELFSDIINHTQVIDSNLRTTQTMKGRNDFEYLANAFKKEPQKTYNMLHRAGWEYYQYGTPEAKKKWIKSLRVFVVTAIFNALFKTPWLVIRDDEDEEFIKKYLKKLFPYESYEAIKKQFEKPINEWTYKDIIPLVRSVWGGKGAIGDNLDVFSSMPLVAEIDSWFQGFSPSTLSYTSILTEANKTVNSLSSATATPYNLLYSVASFSDYVTGLGISNLMKDLRGFWNQTTRVTNLPRIEKSTANEAKAAKTKQINALKDAVDSAAAAETSDEKSKAKTDIDAAVNAIYQEKYDLYINDKEKPKTEKEADKDAKEQTASTITRNFKPIYKELVSNGELNEATNLMNNLIYAYSKVGYKKTKSDFDEWLKE